MENKSSTCHMTSEQRLIDAYDLWTDIMMLPHNGDMISSDEVEQAIKEAPTVDAVEVVHGHWYKAPHHPYRCSNCGEMALLDMYGESHYRSNYCPNCGAKMRGDSE